MLAVRERAALNSAHTDDPTGLHMLFRVLLSALTLFGGHVFNRRPDRVLQIFGLLAVLGIVYSALPSLVFRNAETFRMNDAFNITALVLIGIALFSAALTWKDAKSPTPAALSLGSRLAGGVVSLFGFILLAVATLMLVSTIGMQTRMASESLPEPVYAVATLGGHVRYDELKRAPKGPHPLRGRIVMAGKPVASAEVELQLNGAFNTDTLVTNKQGEFEIFLPAGPWTLNQVSVTMWHGAPKGAKLLLYSGHEPVRDSGYYSRVTPEESPVRIDLPMRADIELPTFELRPSIVMTWPVAAETDISKPSEAPMANVATDSIRWSPVPDAAEYEIQVRSVERKQGTMRTQTILMRRQSGADLPLASLPQQSSDSAEPSEYTVLVYAFDANGKVLSRTAEALDDHAFRLAGETRLAEEEIYRSASSAEDSQYLQDMERLSLVHSLLEYQQIDAARAILKGVSDNVPAGHKAAAQGGIEAMTGNCAAAIPLLDRAEKEGGLGCAPEKYRAMCSSTR